MNLGTRPALGLLLCLLLAGCGGLVSEEIRREATPLPSFADLRRDTEAYIGKTVILGGDIIETQNRPEGTTILVLEKPLGRDERPRNQDASGGRFLARFGAYLDPVLFAPGRRVTVAGVITGTETRPVGEAPYRYVVMEGKEIHLLQDPESRYRPWPYDPFYPYGYDPFWGRRPWWW